MSNVCSRIGSKIDSLLQRWPLVFRKTMTEELKGKQRMFDISRESWGREKEDWEKKWSPLLAKMLKIEVRRDESCRNFMIQVAMDRTMMEHAACYNDPSYWRYMAKMCGVDLERQLATMNYSGLHRLAEQAEDAKYRTRMIMPSFPG